MTRPKPAWFDVLPAGMDQKLAVDLAATLALLFIVFLLRLGLGRLIRRTTWANAETRLKWRSQLRLLVAGSVVFGLFVIWGSELRTLAISLVAVAVALVIATKELILCVMGSILRLSSQSFTVGDRIEVGNLRGDVVDTGVLTTTLLECGPMHERSGRSVVIPNSILLTASVVNETFHGENILHVIKAPLPAGISWDEAETALLTASRRVTAEHLESTTTSLDAASKRYSLPLSIRSVEPPESTSGYPRVVVGVGDDSALSLMVRVPTQVREKGKIEQEVLREYLRLLPDGAANATGA